MTKERKKKLLLYGLRAIWNDFHNGTTIVPNYVDRGDEDLPQDSELEFLRSMILLDVFKMEDD